MTVSITHLNGKPATAGDLAPLAFAGYAHFTSMQVRGSAVKGLDLHLERLRAASEELFGDALPRDRVRGLLRAALDTAPPDVSLACFLTSRPGFAPAGGPGAIDVLIKVTDSAQPPAGPLALDAVLHERHLPHLKHVGEIAKTYYLRQAKARGFDDAAFHDRSGRFSEATIWNLAFWDGESLIWPRARVLAGVTMQILTRRLHALGVPQQTREIRGSELAGELSAVVMNSWTPAVPVSRLGGYRLAVGTDLACLLHEAYTGEPPIPV
ncbi:aminotransferase class IV family protein [Streptomonospora wellingtoniae]|uniref:Aminotransferase class IV family protein n=1 Tax=Streptomonospora wellingtoniae TaxID=3075544 RepID=A0ABU2KYB7_9ACTN|nr:aminotransferase class IV family protein [Streptomonospora sp. DSM 45055]MDT0304306.1 aminotransferase class IV family protein [Streptomonospora sp. DSM 45055]